jgi:DNA-binding transcriptional LysR family regulator
MIAMKRLVSHDRAAFLQERHNMDWDDLRFFISAARARTLTAAAKNLGVDATTVGRRLERLSAKLNTSLFEIGPKGYLLTTSGAELLKHAEDVERSIIAASTALTGENSRLAGTVRLSLSEGFATWVVAPNLSRFQMQHPEIKLEIVTTNGFLNPSKREADLAVMLARPARGPLKAKKLTDYSLGLFASREYFAAHDPICNVAELQNRTLIGYIDDFIYAEELRYLSEIGSGLSPAIGSTSINVQHAMTKAGLGIAVLPYFIGQNDSTLVPVLPEVTKIRRMFWIVVHEDLSKVARVRAVMHWLTEIANADMTLT